MKMARIPFRAIQTPAMRDEVLAQHPALQNK
jgi:hypothetical protein